MDRPDEILQRLIEDDRVRRALQTIASSSSSSSSSLDREAILRHYLSLSQSTLPPLPQDEVAPPVQATSPTISFSLGDISRLTEVLRAANQLQYEQLQQQQLQAHQQQLEQLGSLTDVLRDIARSSANTGANPSTHSVSQTLSNLQGFSTSHDLPQQQQQQRSIPGRASEITIDSVLRCLANASQSSQHSLASAPGLGNLQARQVDSARRSTLHTPASSMSSMTSDCSDLFHQRSNATGSINFSFPQVNVHQAQLSGPLSSQLSGPASNRLSLAPLTELGLASVAASLLAHNRHHNPLSQLSTGTSSSAVLSQLSTGTSSSAGGSPPRFPISTANADAATAAR